MPGRRCFKRLLVRARRRGCRWPCWRAVARGPPNRHAGAPPAGRARGGAAHGRDAERTGGETVGYRIRGDTRVGPRTRIEVVTEGILTRMLQPDPALEGVGLLIFDEFHERSLHADLGLAFDPADPRTVAGRSAHAGHVRDAGWRPGGAAAWRRADRHERRAEPSGRDPPPAAACGHAGRGCRGGRRTRGPDVRRGRRACLSAGRRRDPARRGRCWATCAADVIPLHGSLPQALQDRALGPSPPGRRKVVLATSIAETSLTIDGVRVVIDGGLARMPRFSPRSGMTRWPPCAFRRASADQRRGRAGRQAPGVCYRLWNAARGANPPGAGRPEILEADLAPLALELAAAGIADPAELAWLDPPPSAALGRGAGTSPQLGALDPAGRITSHGRRLTRFALHPRLAHMVVRGRELGAGEVACELAALLSERDMLGRTGWTRGRRPWPPTRVAARQRGAADVDRDALRRVRTEIRNCRESARRGGQRAEELPSRWACPRVRLPRPDRPAPAWVRLVATSSATARAPVSSRRLSRGRSIW